MRNVVLLLLDVGGFDEGEVEEACLRVMATDPSERVRCQAAFTGLRLFATERALDAAMKTLGSTTDDFHRWDLVQAFGVREDSHDAQLQRVIGGLESSNELLRAGCTLALYRFPSDGAERAALQAFEDECPVVRRAAIEALIYLRTKRLGSIARAALNDADATVREIGALSLSYVGASTAEEEYLAAISDPSAAVRRQCVIGLRSARSAEAMNAILKALSDPEASVRQSAAESLAGREEKKAERALVRALADQNEEVRAQAARSLGAPRHRPALPHLVRLLRDDSKKVRWSAARSIAVIDDESAIALLVPLARKEPAARAALWHMAERPGWGAPPAGGVKRRAPGRGGRAQPAKQASTTGGGHRRKPRR